MDNIIDPLKASLDQLSATTGNGDLSKLLKQATASLNTAQRTMQMIRSGKTVKKQQVKINGKSYTATIGDNHVVTIQFTNLKSAENFLECLK